MAQVITRCRATGQHMFMGIEVDPRKFEQSFGPFTRKFCPFCACDHLWHKEDSRVFALDPATKSAFSRQADRGYGRLERHDSEASVGLTVHGILSAATNED